MTIKYVINKEKRTIVAVMTKVDTDVYALISKHFKEFDDKFSPEERFVREVFENLIDNNTLKIKDTIIAKAKCHPDDEWDIEKGMRIAKYKVLVKYRRYIFTIIKHINKYAEKKLMKKLYNFGIINANKKCELIHKLNSEDKSINVYC